MSRFVRRRPLSTFVVSLLAFAAPRNGGAQSTVCPVPGSGAISGVVTESAGGAPVAGVQLRLERLDAGFLSFAAITESGPNGAYQFGAVPPGDYKVLTQGTEQLVDEIWPDEACDQICNPQGSGDTITLAAGAAIEEIDFALSAGGRLEGTVFQTDGATPAAGARLDIFAVAQFGSSQFSRDAASDGTWFADGLQDGTYKVRAVATGRLGELHPAVACPFFCDFSTLGTPFIVEAGETIDSIDFALDAGGGLSGVVTDLAAAPLAGVFVAVSTASGLQAGFATTAADGSWSTDVGLPPGDYRARTFGPHLDEAWDNLPCEGFGCPSSTGTLIAVGAGMTTGIDFALARLGSISGTVTEAGTGEPIANVTVVARSEAGGPIVPSATTAADGTFRIGNLAPADYLLAAGGSAVHVGEIFDDAGVCYDILGCPATGVPTLVAVVGSGDTGGVTFELARGGVIAGAVVIAATGAPVASIGVTLSSLDSGAGTTVFTDALGRFGVVGVPAGDDHRMLAQPATGDLLGEVWEEIACVPGSCDATGGTPISVIADATVCTAFTLDGATTATGISGTVVGESGPLAGVTVAVYDASGAFQGAVQTGGDGTYLTSGALLLLPGNHFVVANGPTGYQGEIYDDLPCAPGCDPTTGTPVAVVDGAATPGIDFELELVGTPPLALIYLEDCKPGGCVYHRSFFEDSRQNRSTIPESNSVSLPEFPYSAEVWADLVACVQRAFRPFAVEVTDVDPGTAPHLEHVVAGLPAHVGMPPGYSGVSPWSCAHIPNSISYTFAAVYAGQLPEELLENLCWTAVHEIAHQHGVDHHAYVPDAMTYIPGCGSKRLVSRDVPCGPVNPEACSCGGTIENSYEMIREVQGPSDFLFDGDFEIVEEGYDCAWSTQTPPPEPPPLDLEALLAAPRCGTLERTNPGFRPDPSVRR